MCVDLIVDKIFIKIIDLPVLQLVQMSCGVENNPKSMNRKSDMANEEQLKELRKCIRTFQDVLDYVKPLYPYVSNK